MEQTIAGSTIKIQSIEPEKQCLKCKAILPVLAFYKKKGGLYGVDSKCKQCVLLSKYKYYKKLKRKKAGIIEVLEDGKNLP